MSTKLWIVPVFYRWDTNPNLNLSVIHIKGHHLDHTDTTQWTIQRMMWHYTVLISLPLLKKLIIYPPRPYWIATEKLWHPDGASLPRLSLSLIRLSLESKDSCHVMMSSCVRLLSIPSPSPLKPAWADNKIRAWRGSLATWPEKQWSFIGKAAADRHDWGNRSVSGGRVWGWRG